MDLERRRLLRALAAAPVATTGASRLAFAAEGRRSDHTVVVVFLRGAMDSIGALIPSDESAYYDRRPGIAVPRAGQIDLDGQFALHDALRPLKSLYLQGDLAFVVGTGLDSASATRSHFDAQARMEGGLSGRTGAKGWLGRYLAMQGSGNDEVFRGVGIGDVSHALRGYQDALNINDLANLRLRPPNDVTAFELDTTLEAMYGDERTRELLRAQADRALNTLYLATVRNLGYGTDAGRFGPLRFGREMRQVAELVNADLGLEAATVDMDGWDLHDSYGSWHTGAMQGQLKILAEGLVAFHEAIGGRADVTVIVMSEFGRRLEENSSYGTDHGRGGMTMVLGGGVNGGRVAGRWSGLGGLVDGDLPVTTDYRQVLAELLSRRLGAHDTLGNVFPGYQAPGWLDLFT